MSERIDLGAYLSREVEAVVQFSDVFGTLPVEENSRASEPPDFDAQLTAIVGNTGRFRDLEYEIKAWPRTLGNYAAVLLDQLRSWQRSFADLGNTAIVGVINDAPRDDSYESGQNGQPFYLAITENGVEILAQAEFLSALSARGLVRALYEISDSQGPWAKKSQFRSKAVARAREKPSSLHEVDSSVIPPLAQSGRLAYFDTFGNVRIEVPRIDAVAPLLEQPEVTLKLNGEPLPERVRARGVDTLDDLDIGELGIYHNPDDLEVTRGPAYLEFARKVSGPNDPNADSGYRALRTHARSIGLDLSSLTGWDDVEFEIAV